MGNTFGSARKADKRTRAGSFFSRFALKVLSPSTAVILSVLVPAFAACSCYGCSGITQANSSRQVLTFSLSGLLSPAVTGSGATVTLAGASTAMSIADNLGNYSFSGLSNENYTVTPTKSGITFTPGSQSIQINGASVAGVSFTAVGQTFSIAGTITGSGGASIALSGGATEFTTADASGNFTFTGLANGTYTLTPSKGGVTFSPASQSVRVNGGNVTGVAFTATAQTYSVTGVLTGGSGATVTLSGASSATTTANSSGNYTFSGLANGTYTVTPKKVGFTFSPSSQSVTINGANLPV